MKRRQTKNFSRQMYQVQNLELPPDDRYVVTRYEVEQWAMDRVFVKRQYRDPQWKSGMEYHDAYVIGPRGAVEQLYSNLH